MRHFNLKRVSSPIPFATNLIISIMHWNKSNIDMFEWTPNDLSNLLEPSSEFKKWVKFWAI